MATTKAKTSKARKPSSGGAKAKGKAATTRKKGSQKTTAKTPKKRSGKTAKKAAKKASKKASKKPAKQAATKAAKKQAPGQGGLVLRLDAAIYPKPVLTQAAKAFAGLARIEVRKAGREQVVTFFDPDPDLVERLPDEFANYALSCLVTLR